MKYKLFLILAFWVFTSSLCFAKNNTCPLEIKDSPALRGIKLGMKKAEVETALSAQLNFSEGWTLLGTMGVAFKKNLGLPLTEQEKELIFLLDENDSIVKRVLKLYSSRETADREYAERGWHYLFLPDESVYSDFTPKGSQKETERFKDINNIRLEFFKDELFSFEVNYETNAYDDATDEVFYSDIFRLLNVSKYTSVKSVLLECKDFSIKPNKRKGSVSISLENSLIKQSLEKTAIETVKKSYEKFKREAAIDRGFKP